MHSMFEVQPVCHSGLCKSLDVMYLILWRSYQWSQSYPTIGKLQNYFTGCCGHWSPCSWTPVMVPGTRTYSTCHVLMPSQPKQNQGWHLVAWIWSTLNKLLKCLSNTLANLMTSATRLLHGTSIRMLFPCSSHRHDIPVCFCWAVARAELLSRW